MALSPVLWESEDSQGRYFARCSRLDETTGSLQLFLGGTVIFQLNVAFTRSARFGADPLDIQAWQQIAVEAASLQDEADATPDMPDTEEPIL